MKNPSKYQTVIFEWVKTGKGNAVVQAVAGGGKTTTIIEAAKLVDKRKKSVFVAFNKSIAEELKSRLPDNVEAMTLHSFGFKTFNPFLHNVNAFPKVDTSKLYKLLVDLEPGKKHITQDDRSKFHLLFNLVPLIKAYLVDPSNKKEVEDLAMRHGFSYPITDQVMSNLNDIFKADYRRTIDYDDMIYIPVIKKFKCKKYDWIFIDELQDLNKVQLALIAMMSTSTTRVFAVGDRKQGIYAFRGADVESMDNFKKTFSAQELPLSISYRCPKKHIEYVKSHVPYIEAEPGAIDGVIEQISLDEAIKKVEDGDLVVCRTNAPLLKMAMTLISTGKKAIVRGKDICSGIEEMIDSYRPYDLNELKTKVEDDKLKNLAVLERIKIGKDDKRKKPKILAWLDTAEMVLIFANTSSNIREIKTKLNWIFSDNMDGIICSTIHKAKGLEFDTVYLIRPDKIPHPMANTSEELEQEYNMKYVALTRSKENLFIVVPKPGDLI